MNQDNSAIDKGYDSEVDLFHFSEDLLSKEVVKEYDETLIENKNNTPFNEVSMTQSRKTLAESVIMNYETWHERIEGRVKKRGCLVIGKTL